MKAGLWRGVLASLLLCLACGEVEQARSGVRQHAPAASFGASVAAAGADGVSVNEGESDAVGGADTADDSSAGDGGGAPVDTNTLPYCLANATTSVSIQANLDSEAHPPALPFDMTDPANTSNFSTSLNVYDVCGRSWSLGLYFAITGYRTADFHLITADGPVSELCAGSLTFEELGALARVTSTQQCQLPSGGTFTLNLGSETSLGGSGTDGMISTATPSNVTSQNIDGNPNEVGVACAAGQKRATSTPLSCTSEPTRELALSMNVSTHEPVQTSTWQAASPEATSNLHVRLAAVETQVRNNNFDLYLRRESYSSWTYHVLLAGPARPLELASGTLRFDPLGRLLVSNVEQALRFPHADGSFGAAIALNLGTPIVAGGSGLDGLTSFDTSTGGGNAQVFDDSWMLWSRCSGRPTSYISEWWVLPWAALQDPAGAPWPDTPITALTVYDTEASPWDLALFWHATGVNRAEYKLVATRDNSRIESGVGSLLFTAEGELQHVERASAIHLPLLDGRPGPGFTLQIDRTIDDGAKFTTISASAYPGSQMISVFQDGAPMSTPCP